MREAPGVSVGSRAPLCSTLQVWAGETPSRRWCSCKASAEPAGAAGGGWVTGPHVCSPLCTGLGLPIPGALPWGAQPLGIGARALMGHT